MKKLLSILGISGLVVSTSAVLVSCGPDKEIVNDGDQNQIKIPGDYNSRFTVGLEFNETAAVEIVKKENIGWENSGLLIKEESKIPNLEGQILGEIAYGVSFVRDNKDNQGPAILDETFTVTIKAYESSASGRYEPTGFSATFVVKTVAKKIIKPIAVKAPFNKYFKFHKAFENIDKAIEFVKTDSRLIEELKSAGVIVENISWERDENESPNTSYKRSYFKVTLSALEETHQFEKNEDKEIEVSTQVTK